MGTVKWENNELWGDNVTQQNISDALQKIGYSRKKDLWVSMNSNEKPLRNA